MNDNALIIHRLGRQPYATVWQAMKEFTDERDEDTPDECWLLQHDPVFTQGLNGKAEHVLNPGDIPVVQIDRGGQVTYHGPGQLVAYTLVDIQRRRIGVKQFVQHLENAVIAVLAGYGVPAQARRDAPGVYVNGAKIASLGLRVRKGRAYHGLAFNIDMDLEPFARINPCGLKGTPVTQLRDFTPDADIDRVSDELIDALVHELGYARHVNGEVSAV